MIKKFKSGGMVVIDKSHKALYRTLISCMEYFNSFWIYEICFHHLY